jgi:hypothetical protein
MAKRKTQVTENTNFVNPFNDGVSYDDFLSAIPVGVSVEDYLKDELSESQISIITNELKHHNKLSKIVEVVEEIEEEETED